MSEKGVLMQKLALTAAAVLVVVTGCSSSEPLGFDLAHAMEPPAQPFTVSGAAVDKAAICGVGMWTGNRWENMDGDEIGFEDWAVIFDTAFENRGVAEMMSDNIFECGDGSGTFTLRSHAYIDFGARSPTDWGSGVWDTGTWTITGTEDYDSLSGSGQAFMFFDEGQMHYTGEVTG